jgi:hypothetical protein
MRMEILGVEAISHRPSAISHQLKRRDRRWRSLLFG